uniref:Serine/threonine kinase 38 n=1 Tax=Ovis aries TaxID=9940 RepID=A0AC11D363_SHEEP
MAMTGSTPCSSMSSHTKERVTMTKVTLENFYSNLIAQHEEREMRIAVGIGCDTYEHPPKCVTPSNPMNGGGGVTESKLMLLAALTDQ